MPQGRKNNPLVSVIVPVYNADATLARALDSLLQQTYRYWEAIIVDDGSCDQTARILAAYSRTEPRIRAFYQANRGRGAARNLGLEKASGEYVTFLDADDAFDQTKLQKQVQALGDMPNADAVVCGHRRVDRRQAVLSIKSFKGCKEIDKYSFFVGLPTFIPGTLFKAASIGDIRFIEGRYGEDWDFCLRLAWNGCRFYTMPGVLWIYNEGPDAWKKTTRAYCEQQIEVVLRNLPLLPGTSFDRWLAQAALIRVACKMICRSISVKRPGSARLPLALIESKTWRRDERVLASLGFGKMLANWQAHFGHCGLGSLKKTLRQIPSGLDKVLVVHGVLLALQVDSRLHSVKWKHCISLRIVGRILLKAFFTACEKIIIEIIKRKNCAAGIDPRIQAWSFAMNRKSGQYFPSKSRKRARSKPPIDPERILTS